MSRLKRIAIAAVVIFAIFLLMKHTSNHSTTPETKPYMAYIEDDTGEYTSDEKEKMFQTMQSLTKYCSVVLFVNSEPDSDFENSSWFDEKKEEITQKYKDKNWDKYIMVYYNTVAERVLKCYMEISASVINEVSETMDDNMYVKYDNTDTNHWTGNFHDYAKNYFFVLNDKLTEETSETSTVVPDEITE